MPEFFLNADAMTRACGIDMKRLIEYTWCEILPPPVLLNDEPLWRMADVRAWMKTLCAATPAEAASALWARWQATEAEACGVILEGGAQCVTQQLLNES